MKGRFRRKVTFVMTQREIFFLQFKHRVRSKDGVLTQNIKVPFFGDNKKVPTRRGAKMNIFIFGAHKIGIILKTAR